jgi:hypothetical protein
MAALDPFAPEHPLFRRSVRSFAAPAAEVFDFVARHENGPAWIPFVWTVEVQDPPSGPGVGTVRIFNRGTLAETHEQIHGFEPGVRLAYGARDRDLKGMFRSHLSILTLVPVEGGCRVDWVVHGLPGNILMRWFARPVFWHVMSGGLRALARRFGRLET